MKRDQERRERAALLEAGQNPYEVSRRREMAAKKRAQQQRIADTIRRGTDAIAARLVAEEQDWQRSIKVQARTKVHKL
jgi:hypothetical protein